MSSRRLLPLAALVACGLATACGASTSAPPRPRTTAARTVAANPADAVVNLTGDLVDGGVAGTGMVISPDGLVLTNNHVVAGTTNLRGQVSGRGQTYGATVLGVDPTEDVALVRLVGASHLLTMPFDTSGSLQVGDGVTAMGNALGHDGSPISATGRVTSLDETLEVSGDNGRVMETLNGVIGISAPIEPGDSGGPLLDAAGHVIGMDTAGAGSNVGAQNDAGLGAAIPIASALGIAQQVEAGTPSPYIEPGHAGVLGIGMDASNTQATVLSTVPGEAAASAGVVAGDVILAIDGSAVTSSLDVGGLMQGRLPGDRLTLRWRDPAGRSHSATVTLSAGPPA